MTRIACVATSSTSHGASMLATMLSGVASFDGALQSANRAGIQLGGVAALWEQELRNTECVSTAGDVAVACDATLYYRDDLGRRLGMSPGNGIDQTSDAGLIAELIRQKGASGVSLLEGDFAFVAVDGASGEVVAARDIGARRTLHYAVVGGELVVASELGAILRRGDVGSELNIDVLCEMAGGAWAHGSETIFRGIFELPGGWMLRWRAGSAPQLQRFWKPEDWAEDKPTAQAAAAAELRQLLVHAVAERSVSGKTAVTLSGGWDSSAVFAAGWQAAREGLLLDGPHSISMSYPEGDPGREDELIAQVHKHWNVSGDWVDVLDVMSASAAKGVSADRPTPWAHPFEDWNRALFRAARARGTRVLLDGGGGDSLFQVSEVFLADLVMRGRFLEARAAFRKRGGTGWRSFARVAVLPLLSDSALDLIGVLRGGRRPVSTFTRPLPAWIAGPKVDKDRLAARDRAMRPRPSARGPSAAESFAFMAFPFFQRTNAALYDFAASEGVECRSPLMDLRVMRLAMSRPLSERATATETKVLLRRAMEGLLPADFLAPRTTRTGVTTSYFRNTLRREGAALIDGVRRESALADSGILDVAELERAWARFEKRGDINIGLQLFFTLQADQWLRSFNGGAMRRTSSVQEKIGA